MIATNCYHSREGYTATIRCFSPCKSLSSILFESNSRLTRIESHAFDNSSLQSIVISATDDLAAIPCERKTKWAKHQRFVFRQRSVPVSPSTVIRSRWPAFWALVLLLFGFLFVRL
jgi:hypothetical protein